MPSVIINLTELFKKNRFLKWIIIIIIKKKYINIMYVSMIEEITFFIFFPNGWVVTYSFELTLDLKVKRRFRREKSTNLSCSSIYEKFSKLMFCLRIQDGAASPYRGRYRPAPGHVQAALRVRGHAAGRRAVGGGGRTVTRGGRREREWRLRQGLQEDQGGGFLITKVTNTLTIIKKNPLWIPLFIISLLFYVWTPQPKPFT